MALHTTDCHYSASYGRRSRRTTGKQNISGHLFMFECYCFSKKASSILKKPHCHFVRCDFFRPARAGSPSSLVNPSPSGTSLQHRRPDRQKRLQLPHPHQSHHTHPQLQECLSNQLLTFLLFDLGPKSPHLTI